MIREQNGFHHQVIAAACSVDHARQVRALYEKFGFHAAQIHSDMPEEEREIVLKRPNAADRPRVPTNGPPWTATGFVIMVISGALLFYAIPVNTYLLARCTIRIP